MRQKSNAKHPIVEDWLLILEERVADGDAFDPHDFTHGGECAL